MTALVQSSGLEPLTDEELEELDADTRKAEAWMMVMTGSSQRAVAARFDVSPATINAWIRSYAAAARTRAENIEYEKERIIGQLEAVATQAWKRHNRTKPDSMAGPSYLKIATDAVLEIARFRGIEGPKGPDAGSSTRTTEIVVRFGSAPPGQPEGAIDVGVRETETG